MRPLMKSSRSSSSGNTAGAPVHVFQFSVDLLAAMLPDGCAASSL